MVLLDLLVLAFMGLVMGLVMGLDTGLDMGLDTGLVTDLTLAGIGTVIVEVEVEPLGFPRDASTVL